MKPYDELATEARAMSAALTEATYDQRFFGMGDVCATVEKAAALLTSIAERLAPTTTDPPPTCTLSDYKARWCGRYLGDNCYCARDRAPGSDWCQPCAVVLGSQA